MVRTTGAASLLRELADAVERVGEDRVRMLLRGKQDDRPRALLPLGIRKGSARTGLGATIREQVVAELAEELPTVASREAGLQRINEAQLNRRELEILARRFDVPVRKDLKVGDLRDLIVNVTIGGRLNSRAIRGE